MTAQTPMMAQWHECKAKAKDALLLFRLGDFYEAFERDAEVIAKEIHLTLTARQGIPMCGVPFHSSDIYIDKLIAKGYKVAIAEQMEDPKVTKGLMKREIVRIITPGTITHSGLLSDKRNNYFACAAQVGSIWALSFVDLTTGEFQAIEYDQASELLDEIHRLRPAELLIAPQFPWIQELPLTLVNEKELLDVQKAHEILLNHFHADLLKGKLASAAAAGSLLHHLKEELSLNLTAISSIHTDLISQYMSIDRATMRALEITESSTSGPTLLGLLDETLTPMGGRLLRQWVTRPLLSLAAIEERQYVIASHLASDTTPLRKYLSEIRDIERLMSKITTASATPRDLLALALSLRAIPHLPIPFDFAALTQKLLLTLTEQPPLRIGEGDIFRDGYHPELDRLRTLARDSVSWMARYQTTLREQTNIKTLKVGYTKAFGYFIEVSRGQSDKVPPTFHRRQTLTNAERFITDELRQFEHQILSAEEQSKALEAELFEAIRNEVASHATPILAAARAIARLDAILSLAEVARKQRWTRPTLDTSDRLEIHKGRHPIVESAVGKAFFIPNDTTLNSSQQMMLITGPNMAGKSTYLRQVALIALLAHIGSFVPAEHAHIGLIDKLFSRIGASDDLARGHSTFMVEMTETAHILQYATSRSLILLDEVGRGTSTYDGIAIAWAVAEFLLTTPGKQAKTLFATHYWELTRLSAAFPHAANFQTAIEETPSGIAFLRKILPGSADKSYGIHVARLAGLPPTALQRAEAILLKLESQPNLKKTSKLDQQLALF